jgi:hypothetical protein
MTRSIKAIVLAAALAVAASVAASATTGPAMLTSASPIGTGSNIAATAQNTGANFGPFAMVASGLNFRCSTVVMRVTAVTTDTATVDPRFSECVVLLSGTVVGGAQFSTPCDWRLSFANGTFNNTTGATGGGTLTIGCAMQVGFTSQAGACIMDFPAQTREGLTLQNIDSAGNASTTATPWGMAIVTSVSGLTYDATTNTPTTFGGCPLPGHGTAAWASSMYLKNVWGQL